MENYNYDKLKELIGETVQVNDKQGNSVSLELAEVNKGALDGDEWEAFSVIYKGKEDFHIPQGCYTFLHPCFGEKFLFVSPNSPVEYETVVTRERKIVEEES